MLRNTATPSTAQTPNKTQLDVLDSFIGEDSAYTETIYKDESFDLGTKISLLERAITENCPTFLQSLDRVWDPTLTGDAREARLNFMISLKAVNDMYFNNEVRYGDFGLRPALAHYFHKTGEINPAGFRVAIKERIDARITAWQAGQEKVVQTQRAAREAAEATWVSHPEWRRPDGEIDLPKDQQYPFLRARAILTPREQMERMLDAFPAIDPPLRLELLHNDFQVCQLIRDTELTLDRLIGLDPDLRTELIRYASGVYDLILDTELTLDRLIGLDPALLTGLIRYASGVCDLILDTELTIDHLLRLDPDLRAGLIQYASGVHDLIQYSGITLDRLIGLDPDLRTELIQNARQARSLILDTELTLDRLIELDPDLRIELVRYAASVCNLIRDTELTLDRLIGLDPGLRAELLRYAVEAYALIRDTELTIDRLIELDPDVCIELIRNAHRGTVLMTQGGVSFEQLSYLSLADFQTVLENPSSDEAQAILQPVARTTRCSLM